MHTNVPKDETFMGLPALRWSNGQLALVILPDLGGKIVSLTDAAGHEWLWRNPHLPWRRPGPETSFVREGDLGGWDECFPTVAEGVYPIEPWRGTPLRDHGEIWGARCDVRWTGGRLQLWAEGTHFPYTFIRTLMLHAHEPVLDLTYQVTNRSDTPLAYLWCAHPLLAITPGMAIELPTGSPVRRYGDGPLPERFAWPLANDLDAGQVPSASVGWASKLFVGPLTAGWAALHDPMQGRRLRFEFDPRQVPYIGLWLNYGGWSGAGTAPYFNLGLEPASGAPDDLDNALGDWQAVSMLPAHATQTWHLRLRVT